MKKTVGTLLHDMANEIQVIMYEGEVFDEERVDMAKDHLRKMSHTLRQLPPEVMGIELLEGE
jgi:hypothetical protein